jgi:hypothetical protein
MTKRLFVPFVAVLVIAISAAGARAQCSFGHPRSAKALLTTLTQAFVSCGNIGGNSPNTTTEGGVPACAPPQTFAEQAGSPSGTWTWDDLTPKVYGKLYIKRRLPPSCTTGTPAEQALCATLNPIGDTTDLYFRVKLKGVREDATNFPANGTGTLTVNVRVTFDDRAGGPMTWIDFPLSFSFEVNGGTADAIASGDAILNDEGRPGLPHCTSIEILSAAVIDENGNTFAVPGLFNP